jgi:hypothetical protein
MVSHETLSPVPRHALADQHGDQIFRFASAVDADFRET